MNKQPIDYLEWSQEYFDCVEKVKEQKNKIKSLNINAQEKHSRIVVLDRIIRELQTTAYLLKSRGEQYGRDWR